MGLFGKKKDEPLKPDPTLVTEPEGAYDEVGDCLVCISLDAKRHSFEAEGYVRFYENDMCVYAPPIRGAARDAMFRPGKDRPILQMRYPYTEISRVSFPRKNSARVDFKDERYTYFFLRGNGRDVFTDLLTAHGIAYEPFVK